MSRYRIMVEGEDGLTFCTEDDLSSNEIRESYEEANKNYPEARAIWSETMRDSFSILQARYDNDEQDLY